MPAIELDGTPQDLVWLQAVKLFPRDKAHRDQLFTLERVRFEALELGGDLDLKIPVSGNVLQTLLESPSYTEMMNQAQEAAKRACIAADILCAIYVMDRFSLPEPSLNKAMALVQAYAPTATYGDRSKLPASLTQIRKCWEEFKPVAHLWAATRINKVYPYTEDHNSMYTDGFKSYLQVAQGFYHFGVSFIPKRARPREPILNAETSWTLPLSVQPKNLHSERLPDRLIEFLKSYKA
jgi:hypothetical protein